MPLDKNDPTLQHPGAWGEASKGWPKVFFDNWPEFIVARRTAIEEIPYGSYVTINSVENHLFEIRLETEELVTMFKRSLRARELE